MITLNQKTLGQLEMKRQQLLQRISKIDKDRTRRQGPLSADLDEQAIESENAEVLDALDTLEHRELAEVDEAIRKLQTGSYGRCESCGGAIEPKRLEALPQAKLCLNCAQG